MQFRTEMDYQGQTFIEDLHGLDNLPAAKFDVLRLLCQTVRIDFDGLGRIASARILDQDHRLVATISLTVDVQEG